MIARLSLAFILLALGSFAHAETIRDYYDEPSLNPLKESLDFNAEEAVDPFSGGLRIAHQDLVIPGNGGMDIVINRIYNSPNNSVGERSLVGVGWTMHFGRVVMNEGDEDKVCSQGVWSVSVADNPSFETPDGGRELLVYSNDPNAYLITRNRWKLDCIANGSQQDIVITSPSGTRYFANYRIFGSYYVNKIVDVRGNTLDLTYATNPNGIPYLQQIDASDGRRVVFSYTDVSNDQILLDTISFDGKTWDYNYQDVVNVAGGDEYLVEVILPNGASWNYDYYPMLTGIGEYGSFAMKTLTYPWGGTIDYTYDHVYFDPSLVEASPSTTVVKTRTVTNTAAGASVSGTWTFDYSPALANADEADITTVTAPDGTHKYYHYGWSGVIGGQLWSVGLRAFEEHFDTTGTLVKQVRNTWDYQIVSQEDYRRGRDINKVDGSYAAPILIKREIWQDGANYITDYLNHDAYGNPAQVVETGNLESRTTDLSYRNDTTAWILGLNESETLQGVGTISRAFNGYGELETLNEYGVVTQFAYTGAGDLATETDARGFRKEYADYYRGTPQIERYEVQPGQFLQYQRVVNNDGTVRSETNPRNYTYSYGYDALGRVASITPPINQQVTINYVDGGSLGRTCQMTVTRGTSQHQMACDGFGKRVEERSTDTLTGESIVQTWERDVIGRVTFASYPNSTDGTQFNLDGLGRVVKETYPDLTSVTYDYDAITATSNVTLTNERGFTTKYLYRAYGNPEDKQLVSLTSPELVRTYMTKDASGRLLSVWQGEEGGRGYERVYGYDTNKFLTSIDEPEVGITTFGRDAVGNLARYQVATSGITNYTRDGLGRITLIDYPNTTPDVTVTYNPNGSLETVANSVSTRTYTYDPNENLTLEHIEIEGSTYDLAYRYDLLDQIDTFVYPSGREVSFVPDALGRPRAAYPYVTDASYHSTGAISQMVYANGQVTNIGLDNRLRVKIMQVGNGSPLVDLAYNYDPSGNVESISDGVDPLQNRNFGYDGDNRLTVANGIWGAGSMGYDFQNNITQMTLGSRSIDYTYQNNLLIKYVGDSRVTLDYDVYRNVTYNGRGIYVFDDAGNLVREEPSATVISTEATPRYYAYDGNGMRVRKQWDTTQTLGNQLHYVYTKGGQLIGEYKPNSVSAKEYVYLGHSLVASVDGLIPPTADAGVDQTAQEGATVTLDGTGSAAYYGTISYQWVQTAGPTITLTGANTATPYFNAPTQHQGVTVTFKLTVRDSYNQSVDDTVSVTIPMLDSDSDGISDNWEIANFGALSQSGSSDFDLDGYSDLEEFEAGTDPVVPEPLGLVGGLSAKPGNGSVTLTWVPVERALGYDIYWSTDPDFTKDTGVHLEAVTSPYVHGGLTNGDTLYYRVFARNDCCEASSEVVSAVVGASGWGDMTVVMDDVNSITSDFNSLGQAVIATKREGGWTVWGSIYDPHQGFKHLRRLSVLNTPSTNYVSGKPEVAINNNGSAIVTWIQRENWVTYDDLTGEARNWTRKTLFASTFSPENGWTERVALASKEGSSGLSAFSDLAAVRKGTGFAVTWFDVNSDLGRFDMVMREYDPVSKWGESESTGIYIEDDRFVSVYGSESGDLAVVYQVIHTDIDPYVHEIWVKRFDSTIGEWMPPKKIAQNSQYRWHVDASSYSGDMNSSGDFAFAWQYSPLESLRIVRFSKKTGWSPIEDVSDILPRIVDHYAYPETYMVFDSEVYVRETSEVDLMWYQGLGDVYGSAPLYSASYTEQAGWTGAVTSFVAVSTGDSNFKLGYASGRVVQLILGAFDEYSQESMKSLAYVEVIPGEISRVPVDVRGSKAVSAPGVQDIGFGVDEDGGKLAIWRGSSDAGYVMHAARFTSITGAPVADAGSSQLIHQHTEDTSSQAILDASGCLDPEAGALSYSWMQIEGEPLDIAGGDSSQATVVLPMLVDGDVQRFAFELTVTDAQGLVAKDTIRVDVRGPRAPVTFDLSAEEGVINGVAAKNDRVVLQALGWESNEEGKANEELKGLPFGVVEWEQVLGPEVTLSRVAEPVYHGVIREYVYFDTPNVTVDTAIQIRAVYRTDAGGTVSDVFEFTVNGNSPPVAVTEGTIESSEVQLVLLDGAGSYDPEGGLLQYLWEQTSGSPVVVENANSAIAQIVTPVVNAEETLRFQLTVTDSAGKTDSQVLDVRVIDQTAPITTSSVAASTSKGKTYYDISLAADEPGTTHFRIVGDGVIIAGGTTSTGFQQYVGPITYEIKSGTATLEYYSIDASGNQEVTKTEVLQ